MPGTRTCILSIHRSEKRGAGMRKLLFTLFLIVVAAGAATVSGQGSKPGAAGDWAMRASIIEACSCPMFCQCYFNPKPAAGPGGHAGHGGAESEHYCRFNNAFQVERGHYGQTKLDGARFWVAGDLGDDFSDAEMKWAVLTFDPKVTPAQREGIQAVLGHLYPVKWLDFQVSADAPIEWKSTRDRAEARLDSGKKAEVVLQRFQGMSDERIVIRNLKYWGAPRNDGFELMPNEVEAWREGPNAFEFKGTNGFMITFDIASKDVR
jgi:hypothetical protein